MEPTKPIDVEFDEQWYLTKNQDVAADVLRGRLKSGLAHYLMHGREEGRLPVPPKASLKNMPSTETNKDVGLDPTGELRPHEYPRQNGARFLNPCALTQSPTQIGRIALIGSCLIEDWGLHKANSFNCVADLIVMNNAGTLPDPVHEYDLLIVQVPLRYVLRDATLWHLPVDSIEPHQLAFEQACTQLSFQLKSRMDWNRLTGKLTFVTNFFLPQRNLMGNLFPRFDLRNPEYFIERLNEKLENLVRDYKNAYILDIDRISSSLGRRFIQDDIVSLVAHNSLLPTPGAISTRMEPLSPMSDHFEVTWPRSFRDALWAEIVGLYRTVRQIDTVKLVVLDLDDTLWDGVSGEMTDPDPIMIEGWPLGFAEALVYLKKRGILLAIVSKNEEERIRNVWPKIFGDLLSLDAFAVVRINWKPKAENLAEILTLTNLLPRSVVFIDDNPVERAAIKHAFPEVRILGRYPYYLRQTLLWSSETQVISVTEESERRTEMVQAQIARELQRKELSVQDFLDVAAPKLNLFSISSSAHPRFARALELINKTNQFNTTGIRWTIEHCDRFLNAGGTFKAFDVYDSFTTYGLVGVVILKEQRIEQWVMSCRVLGYQIEQAAMAAIVDEIRRGEAKQIVGKVIATDVNVPCRDLFAKCGFTKVCDEWVLAPNSIVQCPAHVTLIVDKPEQN